MHELEHSAYALNYCGFSPNFKINRERVSCKQVKFVGPK